MRPLRLQYPLECAEVPAPARLTAFRGEQAGLAVMTLPESTPKLAWTRRESPWHPVLAVFTVRIRLRGAEREGSPVGVSPTARKRLPISQSFTTRISTRRFLARLASVSFGATGRSGPYPTAMTRPGSIPLETM